MKLADKVPLDPVNTSKYTPTGLVNREAVDVADAFRPNRYRLAEGTFI